MTRQRTGEHAFDGARVRVPAALAIVLVLGACTGGPGRETVNGYGLRLADIHSPDDWFHAMRAFPGGIPHGARESALHAASQKDSKRKHRPAGAAAPLDPPSVDGTWFPLGPTPLADGPTYAKAIFNVDANVPSAGRATVIASNPFDPREVWLGTATGGLWHTKNAQSTDPTWVPVDGLQFPDTLPGPGGAPVATGAMAMSIGAIAVDGCSSFGCSRVWIGTGESGVRRDTYYGAGIFLLTPTSLTQVADLRYGSVVRFALPPHAAGSTVDTLYAAVSNGVTAPGTEATVTAPAPADGYGIYKIKDGGATVVKLPIPGVDRSWPTDVEVDPSDPTGNTILAGFMASNRYDFGFEVRGILQGTDGGESPFDWCSINDNEPLIGSCLFSMSGGVNVSGLPAGSANIVTNPPISGVDEALGYATIRFSPNVDGRVYASFGRCGQRADFGCPSPTVYRSDDRGVFWQNIFVHPPGTSITDFFMLAQYGRYTHVLSIVPGLPAGPGSESIVLGGLELAQCSGIGGACSFFGNIVTETHPDHHDVVFPDPFNPALIYNANDGGFFFSTDAIHWTPGNTTLTTSQFDGIAVFDQNVLGGLQDQGMGFFNGTRVWRDRQGGDGGKAVVYSFGSPPTPVWVYTYGQGTPLRSVGDPTATAAADLGKTLPASASLQANHERTPTGQPIPAQCAFFPPLVLNDRTHDIYFATTQVYRSTDTGDIRGDTWTTASPVLATPQGGLFDTLDTDNVITAVGVGTDGTVYVGTYIGELWVGTGTCADFSCWTRTLVAGLPISSITVDPSDPSVAFATLSGFGTTNHVLRTVTRGLFWDPFSDGLVDAPANVIKFDASGQLWLGTDIGIYQFSGNPIFPSVLPGTWVRSQTLPFVPVTDIAAWSDASGANRLYVGTHGRGAWVLTQPVVTTLEAWSSGALRDVPVYGYSFPNTTGGPVPCTVSLIQASGTTCASSNVDVTGGAIEVDANGQLQTAAGATWDNKPVAWACLAGTCLGGVPMTACSQTPAGAPDPLSTVQVSCSPAGVGFGRIRGAPTLGNPPSTALSLDPPDEPPGFVPPASWDFEVVVSKTTATDASLLCRVPVTVASTLSDDDLVAAAAAAVNASASCSSAGVVATPNLPSPPVGTDEDSLIAASPSMTVQSPGSGSQLFVTFRAAPGFAHGLLFDMIGFGNATLRQSAVVRTVVETGPAGAAGGSVRLIEDTDLGTCRQDVPTTPGMTPAAIAAAIFGAFTGASSPGPASCLARAAPRDMTLDGAAITTTLSRRMRVVTFDAAVGFSSAPSPIDVSNRPPVCTGVVASPTTLWPPNHQFVAVALSGATDPDGDPVTLKVTQVRQDENPRGEIDAQLQGGTLLLRAERDGTGDGRVYHVQFTVTDPQGASCSREVTVCVPHDQGTSARADCVDQGALFASGVP